MFIELWMGFIKYLINKFSSKSIRLLAMSKTDLPIIIILGVTGSGKSKLAIEVAQKFNGEVISADSMQVSNYYYNLIANALLIDSI